VTSAQGESAFDLSGKFPGSSLGQALNAYPLSAGGTEFAIRPGDFHHQFAADIPAAQAAIMSAAQRPVTQIALTAGLPAETPAWKAIPSWFVFSDQDLGIPVALHRFMADRAGAKDVGQIAGAPTPGTPPFISASRGPVLLHSGGGVFFGHTCHLNLAETHSREKQVDEISRQCLRRRFGRSAVGFRPVLGTRPERCLIDVKLISEDVTPEARAISIAIHGVGDSCSQDPPVIKLQLAGDMMRTSLAPRVTDWLPAFSPAESVVGFAGRGGPGHRATDPTSHSCSCSSSLRLINCTKPQLSR
jgi:hypothetical protein